MNTNYYLEPAEFPILRRVYRDFFQGNPVQIKKTRLGQRLDANGNYILGCKAGPSYSVSHLFHEMGHLAEREPEKLLERPGQGFGYSFGKYWEVGSRSGYEPQTDQATQREARVWAYQWSLIQHYGFEQSLTAVVASAVYMNDWMNYKPLEVQDWDFDLRNYNEFEAVKLAVLEQHVLTLSETKYTFEVFRQNWDSRMDLLR